MAIDIEQLIADAGDRAQDALDSARAEIANSAGNLSSIFNNPGVNLPGELFKDPAPVGPFQPAEPPTLQYHAPDYGAAPEALQELAEIPSFDEGLPTAPTFAIAPPVFILPPQPPQVEVFSVAVPNIDLIVSLPDLPTLFNLDPAMMPQPPELSFPSPPGGLGEFVEPAPELDLDIEFPSAPTCLRD